MLENSKKRRTLGVRHFFYDSNLFESYAEPYFGTRREGLWWSEIQWPEKFFSSINFVQPIRARLVVEWGVVESVRPVYPNKALRSFQKDLNRRKQMLKIPHVLTGVKTHQPIMISAFVDTFLPFRI